MEFQATQAAQLTSQALMNYPLLRLSSLGPAAFDFTDSMPFSALTFVSYPRPLLSDHASIAANTGHISVTIMASGDAKERTMKQYIVGALATALTAGALIAAAPPAASTEDSLSRSAMDPSRMTAPGNAA